MADLTNIMLSASSLKTYKQCGRKYKLEKLDKATPTHAPYHFGWMGTLVHNSIYYSFADFFDGVWHPSEKIKPIERVKQLFLDIWDGDAKLETSINLINESEITLEKPIFKEGSVKEAKYTSRAVSEEDRAKLLAWDLVKTGYVIVTQQVLPLVSNVKKNVILEREVQFTFEGYNVIGYIDMMVNLDGNWFFFDFKTTKQPPKELNKDVQFYMYRYGLKKILELPYYPIGYYVHLRSGNLLSASSSDVSEFSQNHQQIISLIRGIEANQFNPNLNSPLCNYCEFRGYCYPTLSKIVSTEQERFKQVEDRLALLTAEGEIKEL